MGSGYMDSAKEVSESTKGQFAAQEVTVSQDVDPTTKDDECASVFQAEKNTKKAQKKKDKEGSKAKLNALQKAKENQNINEQDQRGRRISKTTEKRLASLGQFTSKDLSGTIQERSQKLFDGKEKEYQECFDELDLAVRQKTLTPDKIPGSSVAGIGERAQHFSGFRIHHLNGIAVPTVAITIGEFKGDETLVFRHTDVCNKRHRACPIAHIGAAASRLHFHFISCSQFEVFQCVRTGDVIDNSSIDGEVRRRSFGSP